jgi:hypothetical protein
MRIGIAFACVLIVPVALAEPYQARCLITIDGRTRVDGPCLIEQSTDQYRKLTINATSTQALLSGNAVLPYALVYHGFPGGGEWSAEYYDGDDAQESHDLGNLDKDGPCWINDHAKLCAWR